MGARGTSTRSRRWPYLLLLAPLLGVMLVPLYARTEPALLGVPFFFWYQFAWGLLAIAIMAIVYVATRPAGGRDGGAEDRRP